MRWGSQDRLISKHNGLFGLLHKGAVSKRDKKAKIVKKKKKEVRFEDGFNVRTLIICYMKSKTL